MNSSAIDSCTRRREPAQHTWPWLKKMPLMIPSTAWSCARVVEDDVGTLAAKLQGDLAAGAGQLPLNAAADRRGAGEGDLVDAADG